MKIQQLQFLKDHWTSFATDSAFDATKTGLVFALGSSNSIQEKEIQEYLKKKYKNAAIIFSSTAGEILGENVYDDSVSVTAIQFDKTEIKAVHTQVKNQDCSYHVGKNLMNQLNRKDLAAVFVVSDGTMINGSKLIEGFNEANENKAPISGGLTGDGERFTHTYVGLNKAPEKGVVVAIGFYGSHFKTSYGSHGGLTAFGPEKEITRSTNNFLYELNGKSALELYKEYLGPYVDELPASALLFPVALYTDKDKDPVVRTILSLNENEQSMIFAGNMPEGSKVRLMKSSVDKLIDASSIAAQSCSPKNAGGNTQLAILVSCVGRKLILQERTDEEIQAAKNIFGTNTYLTGFYSYGEISPFSQEAGCTLHNQTMTITTFSES